MAYKAVLFDLDGTLLNTTALRAWRDTGHWEQVMTNLGLATALPKSPHLVPGLLRKDEIKVGVVTASRRDYAKALLLRFGIDVDVLVTGSDGLEGKPAPDTLNRALEELGVAAAETVYVGDERKDVEASFNAGVVSVGAAWGTAREEFARWAPDILLSEPRHLLELHDGFRFAAEAPGNLVKHDGMLLHLDDGGAALGRYFQTADRRHAVHEHSLALLALKNSDEPAKMLAARLVCGISAVEELWKPEYIVSVPPKPSQQRNRFKSLFEEAKSIATAKAWGTRAHFMADGLRAVREVEDYKGKGPGARETAIAGAFESNYTWRGKRVLLIDDVVTTGATTREATRALMQNGAGEVRVLGLGKDQDPIGEACPQCGRGLIKKFNGPHGEFYGCTKWKTTGCRYTRNEP